MSLALRTARGSTRSGGPKFLHLLAARVRWWRSRAIRAQLRTASVDEPVLVERYAVSGMDGVTEVYAAHDVFGRPWGFLRVAATGHGSVVLDCDASDIDLQDPNQVEMWVACLGLWLATLIHEPDLVACAVSIERGTAPGSGAEVQVGVRIQLTYRTLGPHGRTEPGAVAAEIGARIPELHESLSRAGVGTATSATAASVTAAVRSAYLPDGRAVATSAPVPARRRAGAADQLTPAAVTERWGSLQHGSAASVTWAMSQVAPNVVLSSALAQLIATHPAVARTRVTLVHERPDAPLPTGFDLFGQRTTPRPAADRDADPDTDPGSGPDQGSGADPDRDDAGSAAPQFAMLVTATVTDPARLPAASRAVVDGLAPSIRPWLRRLYGAQAAGFSAGLPAGMVLTRHAGSPQPIRSQPKEGAR